MVEHGGTHPRVSRFENHRWLKIESGSLLLVFIPIPRDREGNRTSVGKTNRTLKKWVSKEGMRGLGDRGREMLVLWRKGVEITSLAGVKCTFQS